MHWGTTSVPQTRQTWMLHHWAYNRSRLIFCACYMVCYNIILHSYLSHLLKLLFSNALKKLCCFNACLPKECKWYHKRKAIHFLLLWYPGLMNINVTIFQCDHFSLANIDPKRDRIYKNTTKLEGLMWTRNFYFNK